MSKPSAKKVLMLAASFLAIAVAAIATLAGSTHLRKHANSEVNAVGASSMGANASAEQRNRIHAQMNALPLAFEANEGQADPQVKYTARGSGYKLFLTSSQAILRLSGRKNDSEVRDMMMNKRRGAAGTKAWMRKRGSYGTNGTSLAEVRMNLMGLADGAALVAQDRQQAKVNYFIGRDPSQWRSNIPLYGRVTYRGVYPGVDLSFHGASKRLEFDYLVSPGADAAPITMSFGGMKDLQTTDAGDLLLSTTAGPLELHKPVAYQMKDGIRTEVASRFVVESKDKVGFALGAYDRTRELIIDPAVTYSTYFGGDFGDYGIGVAVDSSGNSYVAGATASDTIPGPNGTAASLGLGGASFDTFVTKLDPTGVCVFTSFFGGSSDDFPGGIAIDSQGIYIAGTTNSTDFPVSAGVVQTSNLATSGTHGNNAGYAVLISPDGSTIDWGTYITGSDSTSSLGIAVDANHNLYITGETWASDLGGPPGRINPLPHGSAINLGSPNPDDDGYIAVLNSTGTAYRLLSYIGGSGGDLATGVALDTNGNVYVVGETISTDLPVTAGAVQTKCGTDGACNAGQQNTPQDDAFVVSINASLTAYNYVTYYGGSGVDDALAVAADSSGNAFFTGLTTSSDFHTTGNPIQPALGGSAAQNAFIVELNSTGTTASYATYFGGSGTDTGLGIALDGSGNVYLTGQTSSLTSFPLVNPTQGSLSGGSTCTTTSTQNCTDAFVSVFSPTQNLVLFSTYLGGGGDEDQFAGAIGFDGSQNFYVTGDTDSGNGSTTAFPTTSGALDTTFGGGTCPDGKGNNVPCTDAFVAAYTKATTPDFVLSDNGLTPSSVSAGGSATTTVAITALNGYTGTVNLSCTVAGNGTPLPTCSAGAISGGKSTVTVATTAASAAMRRSSGFLYAAWLPVLGVSLIGVSFGSRDSRSRRLVGLFLLVIMLSLLLFLPACGGSSSSGGGGGGGGGTGTPAGSYAVTITGTDSANSSLSHTATPTLTLTVN